VEGFSGSIPAIVIPRYGKYTLEVFMILVIDRVYNIPGHGPMKAVETKVPGTCCMENVDGCTFWLDPDRANRELSKAEVLAWAEEYKRHFPEDLNSARILRWANALT
jgi:hypothetical protein